MYEWKFITLCIENQVAKVRFIEGAQYQPKLNVKKDPNVKGQKMEVVCVVIMLQ